MGPDQPLTYKGVVYNEMKGAYSSPESELDYQVYKNLFPDNPYRFSSGGYPTAIPQLTYEDFLAFHQKYYHPSNSYILLYGDADLEKELEFIDTNYLSSYELSDKKVTIEDQAPFSEMKRVVASYPVMEGSDLNNQTFLQLSIVTGHNTDEAETMAFDILTDVLVNQESAPVRKALQEAGIGSDVSAYIDGNNQTALHIIVNNANEEDLDRFYDITMETLKRAAGDGIDKKAIEGTLNRKEFNLREGNSPQKGLIYGMQLLSGWFFANDPFLGISFEKPLAEVKQSLTTNYMEELITDHLLSNPHSLLIALKPQPGMQAQIDRMITAELAEKKSSLSAEELNALAAETASLVEYQRTEDSPEALATIPMLALSDIEKEVVWYEAEEKDVAGVKTIHLDEFTNNIIYSRLMFDISGIPEEMIPYATLLADLLGKLDTKNYSYGDLDNEININTGGFNIRTARYNIMMDDSKFAPFISLESKVIDDKTGKMFDLGYEIFSSTAFEDRERMEALLNRIYSQTDASVRNNGLNFAATRLLSYFSRSGVYAEMTGGLEYYWFLGDLVSDFDENYDGIVARLEEVSKMIFTKGNLMANVTCNAKDYSGFSEQLAAFAEKLPDVPARKMEWVLTPEKKNEGLTTTSKVQYVVKGETSSNWVMNGQENDGSQPGTLNRLAAEPGKVIGGAYGGFSNFANNGSVMFMSYRDPNLRESLNVYDRTPEYIEQFDADAPVMTRYIIGTIGGMDMPENPSMKGDIALDRYFSGITREFLQAQRDAVISTTPEDIRAMAPMVRDIMNQNLFCVYGNDQKIKEESDLFMKVINPLR
ncbi:MAG: insulinase family protein [Bacteroidales bacterium]